MQKQIGSIFLIAGTCIGSGVIALPMVSAQLGVIPSLLLMFVIWMLMHYSSLINLELNLQAGRGLSLGALAKIFSGKTAEYVGTISLKLLSYALLAVFIYGGVSITQELLENITGHLYSTGGVTAWYLICSFGLLMLPIKLIDYINRFLFIGLLVVFTVLMLGLFISIDWYHMPLVTDNVHDVSAWCAIIPVIFTSFGFQVIFHTLTNYCEKKPLVLKRAFFWGSFIPAVIYMIWTCGVLSVIYHHTPSFYQKMMAGKIEVGELIKELSLISRWSIVQLLVWWVSTLAIITSILGVGVGLVDSLNTMLEKKVLCSKMRHWLAVAITILPAYFVVVFVPNAFISVLGFAGMILVIIAILLPIYLLLQGRFTKLYYSELKMRWLIGLSALVGILIMGCELFNMLK